MDITSDSIRDYGVKVVTDFLNHQTPLNTGIANLATTDRLEPEAIKRVVEAANTIAYLKLRQSATDKTFEFPVADYREVMKIMITPVTDSNSALSIPLAVDPVDASIEKEASDVDAAPYFESKIGFVKAADRLCAQRERLQEEIFLVKDQLTKQASILLNDPFAAEKLSLVDPSLCRIMGHEKSASTDSAGKVFRDSDLKQARLVSELYKKASELQAFESILDQKIEDLLETNSHVKYAFTINSIPGNTKVNQAVDKAGKAFGAAKSTLGTVVGKPLGAAASAAGMAVGGVAGGVVAAPFHAAKAAVGKGMQIAGLAKKSDPNSITGKLLRQIKPGQRLMGTLMNASMASTLDHKTSVWSSLHT